MRTASLCAFWVSLLAACDDAPATADTDAATAMADAAAVQDGTPLSADAAVGTEAGMETDASVVESGAQNIILLISDDLGLDATECYAARDDAVSTPNIRALCDAGVVFEHAWAMPICSPTRASMLTGRYPHRTGVGAPSGGDQPGIEPDEFTLPRALDAHPDLGYTHANIGKWHLSGRNNSGDDTPNRMGWGHFSGIIGGAVQDFYGWNKVVDGQQIYVERYATTSLVDDAIAWLQQRDGPFVLWMAFNAPHTPYHVPPAGLHDQDLGPEGSCPAGRDLQCYRAAIQAMDAEIGRLLNALPSEVRARTNVIYLGDNGTPGGVAQSPFSRERSKDSLYEGGARVPFVIAGPAVVDGGRRVDAPIDVTDVFATILELAGVPAGAYVPEGTVVDSVSVVPYLRDPNQGPLRPWAMTQLLASNSRRTNVGKAVRDARFKLIRFADGDELFYDLDVDPFEGEELLAAGALEGDAAQSYAALAAVLEGL